MSKAQYRKVYGKNGSRFKSVMATTGPCSPSYESATPYSEQFDCIFGQPLPDHLKDGEDAG